jgi:hypothetical protein
MKCTIREAQGNIFHAKEKVRGQVVGADFKMNRGLALHSKNVLRLNTEHLCKTHSSAAPGYVAVENGKDGHSMLLLVSKVNSESTLADDPDAVVNGVQRMAHGLAHHIESTGLKELALPYICTSSIDPLYVKQLIMDTCSQLDVTITFYSDPTHRRRTPRHSQTRRPDGPVQREPPARTRATRETDVFEPIEDFHDAVEDFHDAPEHQVYR